MSFIGRILKSSNTFIPKNWALIYASNRNEYASRPKSIDVPLPPKRPLSAYMLFVQKNRTEFFKNNPDVSITEQIKRLAQTWNNLDTESKKPFESEAREKIVSYGEQHKRYYESLSDQQKEELARYKSEKKKARATLRLKKALRNSNMPKPPATAYSLFVQSFSKDKSSITTPKDFLKEVAQKWKTLSDEEKKALENKADADKTRYTSEMIKWKGKMLKEGNEQLLKAVDELRYKGKSLLADTKEKKSKKVVEQIKKEKSLLADTKKEKSKQVIEKETTATDPIGS